MFIMGQPSKFYQLLLLHSLRPAGHMKWATTIIPQSGCVSPRECGFFFSIVVARSSVLVSSVTLLMEGMLTLDQVE